jgi:two-component system sensor histidine kinase YesM
MTKSNLKLNGGSLRASLSISFMIMSVIVLIVSAVGIYYGVLDIWQKRSEKSTLQLFEQIQYSVDVTRHDADKVSKLFLVDPDIQAYLDTSSTRSSSPGEHVNMTNKVMERMSIILKNYDYISSIYLFTNGGNIVGISAQVSTFMVDATDKHWFYTSGLYKQAQQSYPALIWKGATRAIDFHGEVFRPDDERNNLLTSMRGVKSISRMTQAGTLVVNINQQVLADTYNKLAGEPGSEIFIYDEQGRIISDTAAARLGQAVPAELLDQIDRPFGSFTSGDKQVIYYRLGETGWTVIKMLPISEFVKDIGQLRYTMIGILTAALVAALFMSYYWIRKITKPLSQLGKAMQEMERGNLGITLESVANNELGMLARGFNRMSQSMIDLIEDNRKAEEQKAKLEIQMLQSQIQPHFLYNTLNTIKWMAIVIKADNISQSLTTLSSLLKPIFNRTDLMWTFREEIDYIDNYIKLMNVRYGQGIEVEWRLPESLNTCQLLRFILQPIMENAIVHGMEAHNYTGSIRIEAEERYDTIIIVITDNGGGITEQRLRQLTAKLGIDDSDDHHGQMTIGIGLQNVNKRIQLHFGSEYRLEIDSSIGKGTSVTLRFPKLFSQE